MLFGQLPARSGEGVVTGRGLGRIEYIMSVSMRGGVVSFGPRGRD